MKKLSLLAIVLLGGSLASHAQRVAVQRMGDGSTSLSSSAINTAILTFNGLTPTGTFALPTSGTARSTDSGSATSNGYFNFLNGRYTIGGYDAAVGTGSVASTNTKTVSLYSPNFTLLENIDAPTGGPSATPPSPWSGNNFRSAVSADGTNVFGSGSSSGTPNTGGIWHYSTSSTTWTRVSNTVTNTRNIDIYNNTLYFSTASGTSGLYSLGPVSGLNLSANDLNTATLVFGLSDIYGFYINTSLGVAYAAADNASGGIARYDFNTVSSTWDLTWKLQLNMTSSQFVNSSGVRARGLSAEFDDVTSEFTIYATSDETSNNWLISFKDGLLTTISAGSSFTKVAQAGTNYVFRGVDVIPEPSAALAVLTGLGFAALRRRR